MDLRVEEFPKCIICEISGEQIYHEVQDRRFDAQGKFNLRHCPACGLLWLDPRPVINDIYKCYIGQSLQDDIKLNAGDYLNNFLALLKDFLRKNIFCGYYGYRHLHKRHVLCKLGRVLVKIPILGSKAIYGLGALFPYFKKGTDILIVDIGCGSKAEYLEIMRNLGWNVLGIEPDYAAATMVENKGIPVFKGTLEDAKLQDSVADQVTMMHLIEHLPEPFTTVEESFRILKEGGRLVIRTPNADSLGHRFFNRHYLHLDPPRHLFVFSPKSLALLFEKSHFKKFYLKTLSTPAKCIYDNSILIKKRGNINMRNTVPQKGRYWFALKEWMLCCLGKDYGEEIELVAIKQ